jgi:hypothetical protein
MFLGITTLCELWPCSPITFHAFLSIAILLKFWILTSPRSTLTSSSHLILGLPILLTAIGLYSVISSGQYFTSNKITIAFLTYMLIEWDLPMVKPDSNFVYHITKKEDGINFGNVPEWNMRHVTYKRVHNSRKSTHEQEEGSIVNEWNVLFDN